MQFGEQGGLCLKNSNKKSKTLRCKGNRQFKMENVFNSNSEEDVMASAIMVARNEEKEVFYLVHKNTLVQLLFGLPNSIITDLPDFEEETIASTIAMIEIKSNQYGTIISSYDYLLGLIESSNY